MEFLFGGPGPGQAAGTVWRPKSLQNLNEQFFSKIGVIFKGHSYGKCGPRVTIVEKNLLGIFLEKVLKMVIGGPGRGQAAGTVWRPKILQNPKKSFFLNRGHFQGSSLSNLVMDDPGKSPLFLKK